MLARRNAEISRRRKAGFVFHDEKIHIAAFGNGAINRAEASVVEKRGGRVRLEVLCRDVVETMIGAPTRGSLRERVRGREPAGNRGGPDDHELLRCVVVKEIRG